MIASSLSYTKPSVFFFSLLTQIALCFLLVFLYLFFLSLSLPLHHRIRLRFILTVCTNLHSCSNISEIANTRLLGQRIYLYYLLYTTYLYYYLRFYLYYYLSRSLFIIYITVNIFSLHTSISKFLYSNLVFSSMGLWISFLTILNYFYFYADVHYIYIYNVNKILIVGYSFIYAAKTDSYKIWIICKYMYIIIWDLTNNRFLRNKIYFVASKMCPVCIYERLSKKIKEYVKSWKGRHKVRIVLYNPWSSPWIFTWYSIHTQNFSGDCTYLHGIPNGNSPWRVSRYLGDWH